MKINTFKLENYLSQHEFLPQHLLCRSDAESMALRDLLDMADHEDQELWNNLQLGYITAAGMPILRQLIVQEMYKDLMAHQVLYAFRVQKVLAFQRCLPCVSLKIT